MHEHAFVRGSYILIIHLRNQDIVFVKINLGDLVVNTIGFTRHVRAFTILLSLSLSLSCAHCVDVVSIFFERTACTFPDWVIREYACHIKYAGHSLNGSVQLRNHVSAAQIYYIFFVVLREREGLIWREPIISIKLINFCYEQINN